eukprot:CAMPEP_0172608588 /NCGR_PEP_ID=MMETSP1068-20121228/28663_1 /TAXON_ID=35684 /ORGANISM="Pseudopedinella elastica, Strain CCMP716" /LENGTH=51 /DNA_ID=CAMNT_0013411893 /DNA_START=87 /DNA_END=242 /DNA_ORIENTATION=+
MVAVAVVVVFVVSIADDVMTILGFSSAGNFETRHVLRKDPAAEAGPTSNES